MSASLLICALAFSQSALPPDGIQFNGTVTRKVSLQYLQTLPEGYDKDKTKRWPLLVFLHGAGERGSILEAVRAHGPHKEIAEGRKFPMIVVSPQCPERQWWDVDLLEAWLNDVTKRLRVDPDRVYLTGLSMGGFGTWAWSCARPDRFAAIAPICGGGDPTQAARLKDMPVWATHGAADPVVAVAQSQSMIDAIKAAGGSPRFDIVKGGQHDVWTDVYAKEDLYTWLLAQRRK